MSDLAAGDRITCRLDGRVWCGLIETIHDARSMSVRYDVAVRFSGSVVLLLSNEGRPDLIRGWVRGWDGPEVDAFCAAVALVTAS